MLRYVQGAYCCSVHRGVEEVVGEIGSVVPGKMGVHPAFARSDGGKPTPCVAGGATLAKDREFAAMALTMELTGFQFNSLKVMSPVRKYATGAVTSMASFGRGYCYLELIREELRIRVARILGPAPLVSDVLAFYRVAGAAFHIVDFQELGFDIYHCVPGKSRLSGRAVYWQLLGMVAESPRCRLGIDKVFCKECGFSVNPEGHSERCTPVMRYSEGDALLGDALQDVDVRDILRALPETSENAKEREKYVSAEGQRRYLVQAGVVLTGCRSDRDWSNYFEANYVFFRESYRAWLSMEVAKGCDESGGGVSLGLVPGLWPETKFSRDHGLEHFLSKFKMYLRVHALGDGESGGSFALTDPRVSLAVRVLDVRSVVVGLCPGSLYTVEAQKYLSRGAMREFLEVVLKLKGVPVGCGKAMVNFFCERYRGVFRRVYVYYVACSVFRGDGGLGWLAGVWRDVQSAVDLRVRGDDA